MIKKLNTEQIVSGIFLLIFEVIILSIALSLWINIFLPLLEILFGDILNSIYLNIFNSTFRLIEIMSYLISSVIIFICHLIYYLIILKISKTDISVIIIIVLFISLLIMFLEPKLGNGFFVLNFYTFFRTIYIWTILEFLIFISIKWMVNTIIK